MCLLTACSHGSKSAALAAPRLSWLPPNKEWVSHLLASLNGVHPFSSAPCPAALQTMSKPPAGPARKNSLSYPTGIVSCLLEAPCRSCLTAVVALQLRFSCLLGGGLQALLSGLLGASCRLCSHFCPEALNFYLLGSALLLCPMAMRSSSSVCL